MADSVIANSNDGSESEARGDLFIPGLIVVFSSSMIALSTLFVQPENPAIFHDSLARVLMGAWLQEHGLYELFAQAWFQGLWFVGFLSIASWAVFRAWHVLTVHHSPSSANLWILVVALLAMTPQLVAWPLWSTDVLLYNLHARISSVHGENPFVVAARELPRRCVGNDSRFEDGIPCRDSDLCPQGLFCRADPYVELSPWSKHPASYGPIGVAMAESAYDAELGIYGNACVFRLRIALYFIVAGLLLGWAINSRVMMMLLWSPIAWLEVGNGGHYEGLMALALVGLYLVWQNRDRKLAPESMGVVGGALLLIKLTAGLLMVPLFFSWLRSSGPGRALRFGVTTVLVLGLGYALVWDSPHPFAGLMAESTKTVRTPLHLLRHFFRWASGQDPMALLSPLALLVLAVWTGYQVYRLEKASPFQLMAVVWLFATCFSFGAFHPWHALVPLVLGLIAPTAANVQRAVLALAHLAPVVGYGAFLFLRRFDMLSMVPSVFLIFGPVIWLWLFAYSAPHRASTELNPP